MSAKTIEVVSIHKGEINLTLKNDETRKILFEDKGPVGYAMVDHDEAEILLSIGRPHYWKPGQGEETPIEAPKATDAPASPSVLSKETYDNLPNVKTLQDLLAACTDVPLVMELIAIESQKSTPRKSWMTALDERHKALTEPAGTGNVLEEGTVNQADSPAE